MDDSALLADIAALMQWLAHGGGQVRCGCGRPTTPALSPEALLLVNRIRDRMADYRREIGETEGDWVKMLEVD